MDTSKNSGLLLIQMANDGHCFVIWTTLVLEKWATVNGSSIFPFRGPREKCSQILSRAGGLRHSLYLSYLPRTSRSSMSGTSEYRKNFQFFIFSSLPFPTEFYSIKKFILRSLSITSPETSYVPMMDTGHTKAKFHGQRSLGGYSPWGHKELNMTEWLTHKHACVCARVLGRFGHLWLFVTLWTIGCQISLSVEFSRQEYWGGLSFPLPGDLPTQGSNPQPVCLLGVSCGSTGKESTSTAGDLGSIPALEGPLEKGKATHSSILA